jgi:broad specificity phosphatase PhoE
LEAFQTIDAVFHSGYRRTIETTEGILRAFDTPPRVRKNMFLRERDSGYAYDMTTAEADAALPWLREYWRTAGAFYAVPPRGESVAHVCERTQLFLNEVRQEQHRRVLVVSHGITIRAFRHLIEGWGDDFEERFASTAPKNCAATWYQKGPDGRLHLEGENQIYWSE